MSRDNFGIFRSELFQSDEYGSSSIFWAAAKGHTEIVKILAPLTGNPNAPNNERETPIYYAAYHGHTEIVKILAPLTADPNALNKYGQTPIRVAKNEEIRTILKSLLTSKNCQVGLSTSTKAVTKKK